MSKPLRALLGDLKPHEKPYLDEHEFVEDLSKLKSDVQKRIQTWCKTHRPTAREHLLPTKKRQKINGTLCFLQRLELPTDRIQLIGLPT